MLESPTFIVCLTDSFHSLDPAQILQIKEFMEVSMSLFKSIDIVLLYINIPCSL